MLSDRYLVHKNTLPSWKLYAPLPALSSSGERRNAVTYSLAAFCSRTGRFGVGIASYSLAIGRHCECIRPHVGIALTQGAPNPGNNNLGLSLLELGLKPAHVLKELLQNDNKQSYRQVIILDREGTVAVESGRDLRGLAGHKIGQGYAVAGDMLANDEILHAMSASFERMAALDLEERLLLALEAGREAGGLRGASGSLPERSAAVVVFGTQPYSDWDLRVDMHDDALTELRRVTEGYKPNAAYYIERARKPQNAIPAMEFADMLQAEKTRTVAQ
jgi:uncharacterized Ntn-hydrolase superfamily protein